MVAVNGDTGTATRRITASAGDRIAVDAGESFDPDGDTLVFCWYLYPETGSYNGTVTIADEYSAILSVQVPDDIASESFHIICEMRDSGTPAL